MTGLGGGSTARRFGSAVRLDGSARRLGSAWLGLARRGSARHGSARRLGSTARLGGAATAERRRRREGGGTAARRRLDGSARLGSAWLGTAPRGTARLDSAARLGGSARRLGSAVQDDDSDGTGLTRRPRHKPRQASGCEPLPHAYSQCSRYLAARLTAAS
jgi:hypothetical protein